MTVGSKVKVFRIGPTARNTNLCSFDRVYIDSKDLYILSGLFASSATPLTFSMEDIHICNSVCPRYVDEKKLSVFQTNVKYLKLKNIQKNI